MIKLSVSLAWDMVTLVPPAIVCQPDVYREEWHEKRIKHWNDSKPSRPLVYFRPVLFYSSLGHVGCKGEIGNFMQHKDELKGINRNSSLLILFLHVNSPTTRHQKVS